MDRKLAFLQLKLLFLVGFLLWGSSTFGFRGLLTLLSFFFLFVTLLGFTIRGPEWLRRFLALEVLRTRRSEAREGFGTS
jgi:hypothetical protein